LEPLALRGIYQLIPLPAKQISLDSPFNAVQWPEKVISFLENSIIFHDKNPSAAADMLEHSGGTTLY
jgi:hypothetical protein